jgi:hypothetical protein
MEAVSLFMCPQEAANILYPAPTLFHPRLSLRFITHPREGISEFPGLFL